MERKVVIFVSLVGIAIIMLGLMVSLTKETAPYFSDDPNDWVKKNDAGLQEIDIEQVTKGSGEIFQNTLQYKDDTIDAVFSLHGMYEGLMFKGEYSSPGGEILMRISNEMDTDDGIIEGYIVEVIENDLPTVYIFVDKDWKEQMDETNIIWGISFQNIKPFDFDKVSNGIFMDKIIDDNRFIHIASGPTQKRGGIAVGNLQLFDFEENGRLDRTSIVLI